MSAIVKGVVGLAFDQADASVDAAHKAVDAVKDAGFDSAAQLVDYGDRNAEELLLEARDLVKRGLKMMRDVADAFADAVPLP